MTYKPPYQSYQESRRRKKVFQPLIMGVLAILLIAVGLTMIWLWINDADVSIGFLSTETSTPTNSPTALPPTDIPTITPIPSETLIPSETPTPTASAPFTYLAQPGDSLVTIAEKFEVDYIIIMILNGLTDETAVNLKIGDELIIPNQAMEFPTPTPLPENLGRGSRIQYFVLAGDSLRTIAERFSSTVEDIIEQNELENPDVINPGQILIVRVNLVPTPTPTFGPSPTTEILSSDTPTTSPILATSTPTITPAP